MSERKTSRNLKNLNVLLPFLLPYRGQIFLVFLALCLTAGLSLSLPIMVRLIVDGFTTKQVVVLDIYFAIAFGVVALLAFGTGLRYYLVAQLGEKVIADIRRAVFARTIQMSPRYFESIMTGEVLSRLTTDTTLILSVIGASASTALRNLFILIGASILLLLSSVKLTAIVMLIVPVVLVPILFFGRRVRVLSRENQDQIADFSAIAAEMLSNVQAVQAFTREMTSTAAFGAAVNKALRAARARITMRALMTAVVIFLIFSGVVGVLWIGMRDVNAGVISVGVLVQFVIYATMAAGSVAALSEIWGEIQRMAGASERLSELLSAEDTIKEPKTPARFVEPVKGHIRFENVSFSYPSRPDQAALHGVSFDVLPGETVALVGPSGAGKSTIFQLLFRFFDPQSGRILIDGVDIKQMEKHHFRQALSLVPQEPAIFASSAEENIRFSSPSASTKDVLQAAKAAQADRFLETLPQGYETVVGERGVMLSGGQRQRIAIARAILRDAPVLLLDEATSALDAESERAVQKAFEKIRAGRTTLIVAHRLATVKSAGRILVMEEGRIVAEGNHKELVSAGGLYGRFAELQFNENALE